MTDVTTTPAQPSTDVDHSVEELAAALRLEVTRLARLMRQQSDTPLTPTQLAALATVERAGPLPVGQLADLEQIGAPTATKVADKLCSAGFVERQAVPGDRRVTALAITAEGTRLLRQVRARKTAWLTTRLAELSPADRADVARLLPVLEALTAPPEPAGPGARP